MIKKNYLIMQRNRVFLMFTAFVLSCVFIAGCGRHKIDSKWRDREVSIDGKPDEWQDTLVYYDENTRVNVGVMNDEAYLYVCLITRNHGLMEQVARAGFTAWFDPKGANNKVLGIHFPSGGMMQDKGKPPETFEGPWQEVEIIGPGKEERYKTTIEAAGKYGISVKTGRSKGYFVYELKVPLFENEQHPYAIGAGKDRLIGLGFESASAMQAGGPPGRGGMGMPGGGGGMPFGEGGMGMPPGGGGPPGGGEGPPGGGGNMPEEEKTFQLWLVVMLAGK